MNTQRVLIVVVMYATEIDQVRSECRTLRCLEAALESRPALLDGYHLLLWDNSPDAAQPELRVPCGYHHATANEGVSGAYNGALAMCTQDGYEWMLLLDDDTEVSAEYLSGMLQCRETCHDNAEVAAIAPRLMDKEFQLSPQQVLKHRNAPVAPDPPRIVQEECFAANSGMMIRAEALALIGGYSPDFWLDYSDIYVFHRLYQAGKRLYFAADLSLQHSMTMLDYDRRMTVDRYRNFLYAEQAFFDLNKDSSQNAVQFLRLFARVFRQRAYRNKAFSRLTFSFLIRRITTSKRTRLQQWSNRKLARQAVQPAGEA